MIKFVEKTKTALNEALVPVNKSSMALLQKNMDEDSDLYTRMTTPVMKLPYYHYLVAEVIPTLYTVSKTLMDIIILTNRHPDFKAQFCKAGEKITAFIAYQEDKTGIKEIKAFSLLDGKQPNPTLAKDMLLFIGQKLKKGKIITWSAAKDNPAVKQYDKVIKIFKGNKTVDDLVCHYSIPFLKEKNTDG